MAGRLLDDSCAIKKPLRGERRGQLGKKLIQPPLRSGTNAFTSCESFVSTPFTTPFFLLHLKCNIETTRSQIRTRPFSRLFSLPDKLNKSEEKR